MEVAMDTLQGCSYVGSEDATGCEAAAYSSSIRTGASGSDPEHANSSPNLKTSDEVGSDDWFIGWLTTDSDQEKENPFKLSSNHQFLRLKREPLKQVNCLDHITPTRPTGMKKSVSSRRRGAASTDDDDGRPKLKKCFSDAIAIQSALNREEEEVERNLIGDFSRPCQLPVVRNTKHSDLKVITHDTMASILNNETENLQNYLVVDCRYPYEFEGGHIQGARNIYTREDIIETFLESGKTQPLPRKNAVLIFHCEFSAEKGPTLLKHLRNVDRDLHTHDYPSLHYPEIYLLEGGYKKFYEHHKELCYPRGYKQMADERNSADLAFYRTATKLYKTRSAGGSNDGSKKEDVSGKKTSFRESDNPADRMETSKVGRRSRALFR